MRETKLPAERRGPNQVQTDRGRDGLGWQLASILKLADLLPLTKHERLYKSLALVNGYPVRIFSGRERGEQEQTSLGIFLWVVMPEWRVAFIGDGVDGRRRFASFEFSLKVGTKKLPYVGQPFGDRAPYGYVNFFLKPWEEVVHEGSTYFPGGQTIVEVEMRLPGTGHRNAI